MVLVLIYLKNLNYHSTVINNKSAIKSNNWAHLGLTVKKSQNRIFM